MDLFKSFQHKADPSKSGFDLSRKHVFSTKVGQLVPCLSVETVPGDHFEIDLASLTRTETFNTAAFLRGKQRFDFFFVANNQTWHNFNRFITQRKDPHSTQQKGSVYCPVFNLSELLKFIWNLNNPASSSSVVKDLQGFSIGEDAIRILDMLGYGNHQWLLEIDDFDEAVTYCNAFSDKYINVFRLAAYQHIWYDFYRNKYWDVYDTGGSTLYQDSDAAVFQHYLEAFNFDDIDCSSFGSSVIQVPQTSDDDEYYRFLNMLSLRYAPWKKDLFTSAMPSQQFGAISTVDISGVSILNDDIVSSGVAVASNKLVRSNASSVVNASSTTVPVQLTSSDGTGSSWSIPSAFDVLSLRKSEALQQWKQNTLRGGNMTDDAFESHYGVKPYYDSDENVHFLGSFSSALQVNPVEATAATTSPNGKVGDLGATGTIVTNGQKISFDCKDFGIIMCVASYVPESEYGSNGIDKANTLYEQFDFFTPEFQNIGLESVPRFVQSVDKCLDDGLSQPIGFAPRYWMYKTSVDRVFGEFKDSYSPISSANRTDYVEHLGSLQPWVSPRMDAFVHFAGTSTTRRTLASLYVSPHVYDNVSAISATNSQRTDFFIHNVFFDIKAIRPMTVLGLPQF